MKTGIDEIAEDIKLQILEKINKSCAFAIGCDKAIDIAQMSQLLVYIRFVGSTSIEKEVLFCKPLQKMCSKLFTLTSIIVQLNGESCGCLQEWCS